MKKKHLLRALEDMVGNYDRAFNEGYAQALKDEDAANPDRVALEYERGFKDGHDAGYMSGQSDGWNEGYGVGQRVSTSEEQPYVELPTPPVLSAEDLRFSDDVIHDGAVDVDFDEDELMKAFGALEGVPTDVGC